MNASPEYGLQSHSVAIACMKCECYQNFWEWAPNQKHGKNDHGGFILQRALLGVQHAVKQQQ